MHWHHIRMNPGNNRAKPVKTEFPVRKFPDCRVAADKMTGGAGQILFLALLARIRITLYYIRAR